MRLRLGLTAKLIIPFVAVFMAVLGTLWAVSTTTSRAALIASLERRSESLAITLGNSLGDRLYIGENDRIQEILIEAQKADPDIVYATMLDPSATAVASTDQSLRKQVLLRDDFERRMARVTQLTRAEVPGAADRFEVATPVRFLGAGNILGTLRLGMSTASAKTLGRRTAWTMAITGGLGLVVGIAAYVVLTRLAMRPLRTAAGRLTELATGASDLTRRLTVDSADEIGESAAASTPSSTSSPVSSAASAAPRATSRAPPSVCPAPPASLHRGPSSRRRASRRRRPASRRSRPR